MQATLERLRQRREEMGDEGGFTLIELLIVIVILGVLAAIVVFAVQSLTGESANAACQSDFKTMQVAQEAYKAQLTKWPANAAALTGTGTDPVTGLTVGPWIKALPGTSHYTIALDGVGNISVTPTGGALVTATDAKTACAGVTA
jgi:general secretion pathway protein G